MKELHPRHEQLLQQFVTDVQMGYSLLEQQDTGLFLAEGRSRAEREATCETLAQSLYRAGMIVPEGLVSVARLKRWLTVEQLALLLFLLSEGERSHERLCKCVRSWYRKGHTAHALSVKEQHHEQQRKRAREQEHSPGAATATATTSAVSPMQGILRRTGARTTSGRSRTRRLSAGRSGWRNGRTVSSVLA